MRTIYDIRELEVAVLANVERTAFRVVISHDSDEIWQSRLRADSESAQGFAADIKAALRNGRCSFCNRSADRIDDIGDLETDETDFAFWCMEDACMADALEMEGI